MNSSASIVFSDGQPAALALGAAERAVEAALARDDDALGRVAQHGIRRAAERAPRAVAGRAFALAPDDLAAQEQVQLVLEDAR